MHRVLVLGGGFGGIATAVALRSHLEPADEVVLVERRPSFVMGLRKNWGLVGASTLAEGERPLAALGERGIEVVAGTIDAIRADAREAQVDGRTITADALVVALGAERDPGRVPGFREHAIDVYDEGCERARSGRDRRLHRWPGRDRHLRRPVSVPARSLRAGAPPERTPGRARRAGRDLRVHPAGRVAAGARGRRLRGLRRTPRERRHHAPAEDERHGRGTGRGRRRGHPDPVRSAARRAAAPGAGGRHRGRPRGPRGVGQGRSSRPSRPATRACTRSAT